MFINSICDNLPAGRQVCEISGKMKKEADVI
jgi:hypothetical protein